MLSTFEAKVDAKHTALLLLDLQHDFIASDGWLARSGKDVQPLQAVIPAIEHVRQTARDCGVLVAFLARTSTEHTRTDVWVEQQQRAYPSMGDAIAPCVAGTSGADFHQVLPKANDLVIRRPAYSGFGGMELDMVLRGNGIRTVVIAGVRTNDSVTATAADAFAHGYYVAVLSDCTAGTSPAAHTETLVTIDELYGAVVPSEHFVTTLRRHNSGQAARSR